MSRIKERVILYERVGENLAERILVKGGTEYGLKNSIDHLSANGFDLKTIIEKYRDTMKERDITQYFEILELDENHVKLDIGRCVSS